MDNTEKFEAAKYRHEDQAKLLQYITRMDLQFVSGFLAIQIALAGFLSQARIASFWAKIGLITIDGFIALICCILLFNNHQRRIEAKNTIHNCNIFLKYKEEGFYIAGKSLDAEFGFRPWWGWFVLAVVMSVAGETLILFCSNFSNR